MKIQFSSTCVKSKNIHCAFNFLLSTVNHITLSFTDFATENFRRNCTTDYVEIREGDNYDAPLQGIVAFTDHL